MQELVSGKVAHLNRTVNAFCNLKIAAGTYLEIGAHRGRSIKTISEVLLQKYQKIHTIGYDVFEMEETTFHTKIENNNKKGGNYAKCNGALQQLKNSNNNFTYELHKGYTTDTLIEQTVDWAFIDGGHSYDTVKHDHQKLKNSKVIIFDDADLKGVNKYLWEIKDEYKLYDLFWEPNKKSNRQVIIINDQENYNFDTDVLYEFRGSDPNIWKPIR